MYKIADSHNDFLWKLNTADISAYLKERKKHNLRLLTAAVWTSEMSDPVKFFQEEFPLRRAAALSVFDRINFSIEDAGFLTLENIDILNLIRPLSATPTWNYENALAGGAFSEIGLKPLGREIIKEFQRRGILVDTAHLSRRAFFDCAEFGLPILNSHSCIADIFTDNTIKHRNLTKDQIKLIAESKGFLGITFVPYFLCGSKTACPLEKLFAHIDFAVQNFGVDFVGLGSDFFGASEYPDGLTDYSDYPEIAALLTNHGYKDTDIERIFYSNYEKFLSKP